MKKYRMPFKRWEDATTALIRKEKTKEDPRFVDPDFYLKRHLRRDPAGNVYFLNKKNHHFITIDGPFSGRYKNCEELVNRHSDETAYIVAPGPSIDGFNLKLLSGKLSFAVNSSGFAFKPTYWVIAEGGYARWLYSIWEKKAKGGKSIKLRHEVPYDVTVLATARVAVILRHFEKDIKKKNVFREIYVIRWEEERVVPPRTPAVSLSNALVSAWEMGCKKAYLIGVDLSKPDKKPYSGRVPYTKEGAENPFDDQVKAVSQFRLPEFEIINCSPYSKDFLPFEYVSYDELSGSLV